MVDFSSMPNETFTTVSFLFREILIEVKIEFHFKRIHYAFLFFLRPNLLERNQIVNGKVSEDVCDIRKRGENFFFK